MNVCIFCSANELDKKYVGPVRKLAALLGKAHHTLLWGGSDCGLMKVIADGVQGGGGKIIGVTTEFFKDLARQSADEMVVTRDLSERKMTLLKRADIVIVLPGGFGTLDEITEAIEHKRHGIHDCEIVILNVAGFYDGLESQIRHMAEAGFLPVENGKKTDMNHWIRFVETPEQIMELLV